MVKDPDAAQDKAMISKAVHKHETHMHKGHGLTKLRAGGPTSAMRKKYGKNMAKVVNQRGHSRGT
jgi:hypothetical protein